MAAAYSFAKPQVLLTGAAMLALGVGGITVPGRLAAQGAVGAQLSIPAPSPYLADWASSPAIAQLIVTNSTGFSTPATVNVRLLQGGGRAATIIGTGPSDITNIPASPATVFLTPQIARWRDVVFTGTVGAQYRRTGRLPEGQYTLCVDFSNMQLPTGGPIPNASGCGNFTVTYPQPPRLLAPANESQVAGPYPTFQWTPVITPGAPQVDYLFRVVEVLPGQTSLQAISGNVPLLEVPVHLVTSLVYPPAALPLENGKQYAWRVQAVNALNNEPGQAVPVGANEGRSEIFTFTKGALGPAAPPPTVIAKKPPAPVSPPGNKFGGFPLYNASLSGTLQYTFKPGSVPAAKKVATPSPYQVVLPIMASLENPLPQGKSFMPVQQQAPIPPSPQMAIALGGGPPGPDPGPLAGVTVRLIVRYRTAKSAILTNPVWAGSQSYTDNGHIVATTTTGADGHFTFLFHDDPPTGVIAKNASVHWGSGDIAFGSESNAPLVRYYNLEVGDGHFLNPSDELTLDSTKSGDVGTLISLVRSYNLVVRVVKQQNPSEALPAVTVQLLRGERPSAVPENEGPAPAPRQLLGAGIPHMYYQVLPKWEILGQGETDVSGRFKLTRLVKNIGPSDQYRVRVSTPEGGLLYYETAFVTYAQSWPLFGPQGDATYFNEQYQTTRTDTLVIKLVPMKARYVGRLMRADTLVPLPYGRADLCYNYTCIKRYVEPEDHGYFSFSDITPKTAVPPYWRVDVGSMGFIPQSKDSLALLLGTQHTGDVFNLVPDAHVKGYVVDEAGHPVFAYVQVDDGAWFKASPAFVDKKGQAVGMSLSPGLFGLGGGGGGVAVQQAKPPVMQQAQPNLPQAAQKVGGAGGVQGAMQAIGPIQANNYVFDFDAVSGTQHLRLMNDPKYFPVDTVVTIPKGGPTNLGTFTIYRRLHRLRLRVAIAGPPAGGPAPSITGAVVTLDLSGHPADTSDANGFVEFVWEAPDSSVNVSVVGPAGKDFISKSVMLQVPETRTWTNRIVALVRGTSIAGRVFAGPSDSAPVPGARVFVDLGSDSASIETHSDSSGAYILHAVPIQTVVVRAGKSQSNFIGDSAVVAAKLPAVTGQDFHLQFYQGMDITRLLGFPMEVYSLQALPGDKALVRGALVQLPANAAFKPGVSSLPFDSVTLQSDGTPAKHAVPVAGVVLLRDNELALDPFGSGAYIAKQSAATGLQVRPTGGGGSAGAVFGPVQLDVGSSLTAVTSAEIDSLPTAYLLKPGATGDARSVVASITADSSAPVGGEGWNLGTAGGGRLHFRLYGFRADADSAASFMKADALYLKATLHTDIQGLPDLALQLPALQIVPGPGPSGGVKPASDSQAVDLKLGVWTLHAATWYLSPSEARVYLAEGEIRVPPVPSKPLATIAFHFTGVSVTPTALGGGNFGTGPILLAGVVPLTSGQPIKFVMESPAGPWSLTALNPTIAGLPGMDPGSEIALDNFSFKSDGTSGMTLKGSAKVSYFHTADYAIKAMGVTETSVQFDGNLDLHVPNLPPNGFIFTYSKSGNGVQLAMPQLNYPAFDVGGASITLKDGKLDAGGFSSGGTLTVTGKWTIPIAFTRTPLNGTNQISAVPVPGATLGIGEVQVSQLTGGSKVSSGTWSTAIDGHMDVNGGETSGPFHLDVAGTDVNIGSTGLTVKNISTPFGDIVITLDYPEQRIVGTLEIDHKELTPGTVVTGSAELAISGKPSNRYWYFFAGANADLKNPELSITVAIVLGSATLSGELLDKFNQYSNKGLPASFQTINGFFFEGKVAVPIPICPNGDIDVGIASIEVWCQVWGDLRLGMNFQQLNTYHIGLQFGADVGAKGGVGLGVCLHVSGEVKADAGLEGEYRSDGAWYVLGEMNFSLSGEVSGGVGIDDVCIEASAGFSLGLHAEAQEGYNWNTGQGRHISISIK